MALLRAHESSCRELRGVAPALTPKYNIISINPSTMSRVSISIHNPLEADGTEVRTPTRLIPTKWSTILVLLPTRTQLQLHFQTAFRLLSKSQSMKPSINPQVGRFTFLTIAKIKQIKPSVASALSLRQAMYPVASLWVVSSRPADVKAP